MMDKTTVFMSEDNEVRRNQFIPAIEPPHSNCASEMWFVFSENRLLVVRKNGGYTLPDIEHITAGGGDMVHTLFLGTMGNHCCYAAMLSPANKVSAPCETMSLRTLMGNLREELFWIAGRARHLLQWDLSSRFCGRCGNPTNKKIDERAKICPACGYVDYPRLSPAVIVAVLKDQHILLAQNNGFRDDLYSVLAGFVDPGETLEQCVEREVKEEVGLSVKKIRYFGSQPWLFPSSMMVGFLADYAEGDIVIDGSEIKAADWFSSQYLPNLPPKISIARQMIDWFVYSRVF